MLGRGPPGGPGGHKGPGGPGRGPPGKGPGEVSISYEDEDDIAFEFAAKWAEYRYNSDYRVASDLRNNIKRYNYMQAYFKIYVQFYTDKLEAILRDEIDVSLVLYDEVEYFRPWSHSLFSYPYIQRKNIL